MAEWLRVVVVEDGPAAAGLTPQLEALGHNVVGVASDGREVLATVRALGPDVLLLDIRSSGADGLEVCRQLMAEWPLPIVVVTGQGDHELIAQAEAYGATGFLLNPSDGRRLDTAIAQARVRFGAREAMWTEAASSGLPAGEVEGYSARPSQDGSAARPDRRERAPRTQLARIGRAPEAEAEQPLQTRVFLIGTNELMTEALGTVLKAAPELDLVGTYFKAFSPGAVAQLRETQPDVVLLSCVLNPHDAPLAAAELLKELPDLNLIVLVASPDEDILLACLRAEAVPYALTDHAPAELIRTIQLLHGGQVLLDRSLVFRLLTRPTRQRPVVEPQFVTQPLAPREREVLQALATGMSTTEVAAHLEITVHTVRTHLKNALIKLQVRSKLEAVMLALKEGLIELPA